MPLQYLDHVNIRTAELERLSRFYEQVLGLPRGPRPPFSFGGAWHYAGERAALHLVEVPDAPPAQAPRLEHFAFRATGLDGFVERLDRFGVEYRFAEVPEAGTLQVHFVDPDGNHVEVQFDAAEDAD